MMRTFAVILLLAIGAAAETGSEDKEVRLRGAYSTAHHFSSKYRSSSARRRLCGLPCFAAVVPLAVFPSVRSGSQRRHFGQVKRAIRAVDTDGVREQGSGWIDCAGRDNRSRELIGQSH